MKATMQQFDRNSFVNALRQVFDEKQIIHITDRYQIGTKKDGACFFFQIDTLGRFRYGKEQSNNKYCK